MSAEVLSAAFTGEVHRLAAAWPMLDDERLALLAEDIAEHGLDQPLTLDAQGRLIDGRNRLAACQSAGVEPRFECVALSDDGEVAAFIATRNAERRHLSAGQQAAGRALMLVAQGKRRNGRWMRGAMQGSLTSRSEQVYMSQCGLVADFTGLLPDVLAGTIALDAAYREACDIRDAQREQARAEELRAELLEQLRTRKPKVADLVDAGELTLDEGAATVEKELAAEAKAARDASEAIAKFSADVAFSIGCLAPLHKYPDRREQVPTLILNHLGGAHITAEAIADAIASLEFIAATHKENL